MNKNSFLIIPISIYIGAWIIFMLLKYEYVYPFQWINDYPTYNLPERSIVLVIITGLVCISYSIYTNNDHDDNNDNSDNKLNNYE